MTTSNDTSVPPRYARGSDLSLARAFWIFLQHLPPRGLVALVLGAMAARVVLGGWTLWDLMIPAILIAIHPLSEWLIHVYILHFEPKTIAGRNVDLHAAQHHRAHHRDPWDLRYVVMPAPAALTGLVIIVFASYLIASTPQIFATLLLSIFGVSLFYEWCHYLVHTSYRPRTRWFRRIWRFHRLHHYKNEHYWMGVTMFVGDYLFGTMPADKDAVETSPTCRTLLETEDRED